MIARRILGAATGVLLSACASIPPEPFEDGPVSKARLSAAGRSAGFSVREADVRLPRSARSSLPFTSLDYDSARLSHLRKKYGLEQVVAGAPDEWHAQLRLKEWVYKAIPGGNPKVRAGTAREILEHAAKGQTFYCTHYAITYVECALALGWQARKIAVDRKHGDAHGESSHHGIAEVWSNQLEKWIVIDPQSNLHFEKEGVPLDAWEIRAEWLRNKGKDVDHLVGVPPSAKHRNPGIVWWKHPEDETSAYFWLYVEDHVASPTGGATKRLIFPQDDANKDLTWYQSDHEKRRSRPHTGYLTKRFVPTSRIEDAYWTIGTVDVTVTEAAEGRIRLSLSTYHPGLRSFQVARGEDRWETVSDPANVEWRLSAGRNSLRLRTLGPRGIAGPESRLSLLLD